MAAVTAEWGGVDILLDNAGTSAAAAFEKVDDDAWQADLDLKLMGAVRMCRLVIPHMRQRGGGCIVNVTTVGGKAPRGALLPASVSRAAGITSQVPRKRVRRREDPVNTICIGLVRTAQVARLAKGDLRLTTQELAKSVPLGRVAHASEFGDVVAFLVSERATYITGTAINFDGGRGMTV